MGPKDTARPTISRRRFIASSAAAGLLPFGARAQGKPVRVAWLSLDRTSGGSAFFDAFVEGMRNLGYVEGRNLVLDARWADGAVERLDTLAAELAKSGAQVVVAQGGQAIRPASRYSAVLPVVFGASGDPVESGLVETLARPGRNMTGISFLALDLVGKRMEVLKEALPALKRVAIIANPQHPGEKGELRASEAAAKNLGLTVDYFPARNATELETALAGVSKSGSEAIVVFPDGVLIRFSERIAQFALAARIPAISGWSQFADRGNLASYGPNLRDSFRRLAVYVDKILKGAKAGDIPVELPTTVELVVNLKTAKALSITIPRSILVRADRVIQ